MWLGRAPVVTTTQPGQIRAKKNTVTPWKLPLNTKNDGLERCTSFQTCGYFMLFWDISGIYQCKPHMETVKGTPILSSYTNSLLKSIAPPIKGWGPNYFLDLDLLVPEKKNVPGNSATFWDGENVTFLKGCW